MSTEFLTALALFGQHLTVGVALTMAFTLIYVLTTPHKEIALIREGNTAAAIGLIGAVIGFVQPLGLVLSVTADPMQVLVWGLVALIAQVLAHGLARLVMPKLSDDIAKGRVSAGVVQAGVAIVTGLLVAGSMTP